MAYSVLAQVQRAVGGADKLLQLTDTDGDGVAEDVVAQAIETADELINSYAGKRWKIPPAAISTLSARMAARILRSDRGVPRPTDAEDEVNDRKWLKDIADGTATLPEGTEAAEMIVDKAEPRDAGREVSRLKTRGYW